MYNLTDEEANVIKDVLKAIGNDRNLNKDFARAVGMETRKFNRLTDSAFNKLGNGRLTVETV